MSTFPPQWNGSKFALCGKKANNFHAISPNIQYSTLSSVLVRAR